jgi:sugar lactone lactonase YvrE
MLPDGTITHEIKVGRRVFACMLGGNDRRQLFILSADTTTEEIRARSFRQQGVVEVLTVEVPGAGLP